MASVSSQLREEVTAHAQSDSLKDAREICADSTYFPNNLGNMLKDGERVCSSTLKWMIKIQFDNLLSISILIINTEKKCSFKNLSKPITDLWQIQT